MPTASKTWSGEGVVTNAQVIAEIGQFFKENGVERVVMAGGNAGCPHEAGVDYPVGEACPFCPYWNDK
jgi:hypothetical protein